MVFTAIGFLIMLYAFSNYKRAFCFFVIFEAFLNQNIALISIPGVPLLSLEMAMSLFFAVMYFIKVKKRVRRVVRPFPFKNAFIFLAASWFVSSLFAVVGFSSAFSQFVGEVTLLLLLPWLLWALVERDEDFRFLFAGITLVFLFASIYAIFESMIGSNPLMEYEQSLNHDPERTIDFTSDDKARGWRTQSIFLMSIGAGMNFMMYPLCVLALKFYSSKVIRIKPFHLVVATLCFVSAFLTRSRAPILFFLIAVCFMLNPKKKQFWLYAGVAVVTMLIVFPILSDSGFNVFSSIFNADARDEAGGSNLEQRMEQLAAAFLLFSTSVIWGLGPKFAQAASVNSSLVKSLLGSESIWFKVMPQYGLIGIASYIYLIYVSVFKLPRVYKSKFLFWLNLSYWLIYSITSLPGMYMPLFYLMMFYAIKHSPHYNKTTIRVPHLHKKSIPSISEQYA